MANAPFNVGAVYTELKADITDFQNKYKEARGTVDNFKSGLANFGQSVVNFGNQAAVFTGVVGAAVGVATKFGLDGAAKFEQYQVAFNTLLKDQKKAAEAIKAIQEDAAKTPFELAPLVAANQRLISAGVSAKDARVDIINLGNAIAATGGGGAELERLSTNLQQIKAVGKASALDIKQFAFAGINVYQLLANATGKNVEQVRNMEVSYDLLSKAFAKASAKGGMFEGAMQTQSRTLNGLLSTLKDTVTLGLKDILTGTGAFDALRESIAQLIPIVESGVSGIISFIDAFKKSAEAQAIISQLTSVFKQLSDWVGSNQALVITFLQGLAIGLGALLIIGTITALLTALFNPLTLAVMAIAALYTAWQTNFWGMRDITNQVITFIIDLFNNIFKPAFDLFAAWFVARWEFIKQFLLGAWQFISGTVQFFWGVIYGILSAGLALMQGDWQKAWDQVVKAANIAWQGLQTAFNGMINMVSGWAGTMYNKLVEPFENAWNKIKEIVENIKNKIDFTQRHSPSVIDIIQKGVKLANTAFDDLNFNTNFTTRDTVPAFTPANGYSAGFGGITVNLPGALVSNEQTAMQMGELIGDSIIKKLTLSIRP